MNFTPRVFEGVWYRSRFSIFLSALALICIFQSVSNGQDSFSVDHKKLESQIRNFIPAQADVMIWHRGPNDQSSKILENVLGTSSVLPVKNIELLIAVGNQKTFFELIDAITEEQVHDIAAEILLPTEMLERAELKSKAKILNENFCALVRLKNAENSQDIFDWLFGNGKLNRPELSIHKVAIGELIHAGREDLCAVLRLDPKTYIIGNRGDIDKRLQGIKTQSNGPVNQKLTSWVQKMETTGLEGDYFFGIDTTLQSNQWKQFNLTQEPWSSIGQIKAVRVKLNVQQGDLANCEMDFERPAIASLFKSKLESTLHEKLLINKQQLNQAKDDRYFPLWQAHKMNEIASSVVVTQQNKTVAIKVPRPENFAELTSQFADKMKKFEQQQKAQFESIAVQLNGQESSLSDLDGVKEVDLSAFEAIAGDLNSDSSAPEFRLVKTVSTLRELKPGDVITANDVTEDFLPKRLVSIGGLKSVRSVIGKTVRKRLHKGQTLMEHHVK